MTKVHVTIMPLDINDSITIFANNSTVIIENATSASPPAIPPDIIQLLMQNLSGITAVIAVLVTGGIAILSNRHNAKMLHEQLDHQQKLQHRELKHQQKLQYITTFKDELIQEICDLKTLIGNGNKNQITEYFNESKYIPLDIQNQVKTLMQRDQNEQMMTISEKNQIYQIIDQFFIG
jgi:basic membrane lipoprotein Med (substrate-binding protein (PBP1-ABC) superfamily)